MVRLILVILTLLLFFIITLPLFLFLLLLGKFNRKLRTKIAQPLVNFGFRCVLFSAGTKVTVKGKENVPTDRAVLFAGNHRSFADIPIIYTTVPVLTGIIAKKEIQKVPFLSWWMRLVNCFFLDRDNMKEGMKTILSAIDDIKHGYSVFVMPEGTRNHDHELLPFKEGSFKIADKTGCPIIPVAIWKSDEIFELHIPKVKRTKVTITYGAPILPDELSKEERKHLGSHVQDVLGYCSQVTLN